MSAEDSGGEARGGEVRLDKWLWAVRLFKTRTLATEACRAGHIKVAGRSVKPAYAIRPQELITAQVGPSLKTVRVLGLIERRVGAQAAKAFVEDLTPESERRPPVERRSENSALRHRSRSKKDRRALERIRDWFENAD